MLNQGGEKIIFLNDNIYFSEEELRKWVALVQIKRQQFWQLPVCNIDFSNFGEVAKHDKLVALVESMLELQKKHHEAKMEQDKELYERQIKIVDAQIDRLVYELYGLTEEEIKVVEHA